MAQESLFEAWHEHFLISESLTPMETSSGVNQALDLHVAQPHPEFDDVHQGLTWLTYDRNNFTTCK